MSTFRDSEGTHTVWYEDVGPGVGQKDNKGKILAMHSRHHVAILALPGSTLFETGIALQALGFPWDGEDPLYDTALYGPTEGVQLNDGASLTGMRPLTQAMDTDTIIVPATTDLDGPYSEDLLDLLCDAQGTGVRIVSICTGAFILAAAGLLDGRTATTHWRHCELLAHRFPKVTVRGNCLYIDDEVITGAGSAAGIDLCLHLIRKDYGSTAANTVARNLVVSAHRPGGQAQFARHQPLLREASWISQLTAHVDDNITATLQLHDLAAVAGVSPRTLTRRFGEEVGESPAKWVVQRRVEHARTLLETTTLPLGVVAARCGFNSPLTLRISFRSIVGINPKDYRAAFAT